MRQEGRDEDVRPGEIEELKSSEGREILFESEEICTIEWSQELPWSDQWGGE